MRYPHLDVLVGLDAKSGTSVVELDANSGTTVSPGTCDVAEVAVDEITDFEIADSGVVANCPPRPLGPCDVSEVAVAEIADFEIADPGVIADCFLR